jgi:CubicO group peptidase (beta-lactamase class C family)
MVRRFLRAILLGVWVSVILFPLARTPIYAQTPADFSAAKAVDEQMNALLTRLLIPAAGIALIKEGQVVYTQGYGYSNVAEKRRATADSQFAIGSVSKSVTAAAIMHLVEAGKIELDAPVIRYLPELKLSNETYTPLLTVRHLLLQTSGLPRADELWAFKVPASRAQAIADVATIEMVAKPGEKWNYCNQNYMLLGAIIEAVSGMSYESYTKKSLFAPLGMTNANFTIEELFKSENPALPYQIDFLTDYRALEPSNTGYQSVKMLPAAGAINASPREMAAYALMQLGKGKSVLSADSIALMHKSQTALTGNIEGDQLAAVSLTTDFGYGFGWFTENYRGKALVSHGGSIEGYIANVTLVPAEGVAVVVLTNSSTTGSVFTEIARLSLIELLTGLTPTEKLTETVLSRYQLNLEAHAQNVSAVRAYRPDSATLKSYEGDYTGITGKFTLTAEPTKLLFKSAEGAAAELIPFADGKFLINGQLNSVIEFRKDANGVKVYQSGVEVAQRIDNKSSASLYTDPKGRFTLPIPTGVSVEQKGDQAIFSSKEGGYTLIVTALTLGDSQQATITALAAQQTPPITGKAIDVRKIPVGTLTWTQYLYEAEKSQIFVVEALTTSDMVIVITITGDQATIGKATATLNALLIGFKLAN